MTWKFQLTAAAIVILFVLLLRRLWPMCIYR